MKDVNDFYADYGKIIKTKVSSILSSKINPENFVIIRDAAGFNWG